MLLGRYLGTSTASLTNEARGDLLLLGSDSSDGRYVMSGISFAALGKVHVE